MRLITSPTSCPHSHSYQTQQILWIEALGCTTLAILPDAMITSNSTIGPSPWVTTLWIGVAASATLPTTSTLPSCATSLTPQHTQRHFFIGMSPCWCWHCHNFPIAPPWFHKIRASENLSKKNLQMHTKPPALHFSISLPSSMHLVHQDAPTLLLSIFRWAFLCSI